MTLSEQELKSIKEEAERLYPATYEIDGIRYDDGFVKFKREAYIAAATKYQERIKKLTTAMETAYDDLILGNSELAAKCLVNALRNYNESLKTINNGESA